MIYELLAYILIACWIVILGFYLLTLAAIIMIEKMFHVKHRKEEKHGQLKNSNHIKTNHTEHDQSEELEKHDQEL